MSNSTSIHARGLTVAIAEIAVPFRLRTRLTRAATVPGSYIFIRIAITRTRGTRPDILTGDARGDYRLK